MLEALQELKEKFILDFIVKERWRFITDGVQVTLQVTVLAALLGLVIGILIGVIRTTHDQTPKAQRRGIGGFLLNLADLVCRVYLTVIRGTPMMVQLLIMYFIILISVKSKVTVAVLTFGINSGAYVAEIIRGGILSVDRGQMEAGRSLGLGYITTMKDIVMPQAMKNVLPSLINELITLLKETSICGYIGLNELTRGGDIIRGATFDATLPLYGVALIYLVLVMVIQWALGKVEKRLRSSDLR